jgi:hypothetical protein
MKEYSHVSWAFLENEAPASCGPDACAGTEEGVRGGGSARFPHLAQPSRPRHEAEPASQYEVAA